MKAVHGSMLCGNTCGRITNIFAAFSSNGYRNILCCHSKEPIWSGLPSIEYRLGCHDPALARGTEADGQFWYTVRSWWRGVHSSEYSLSPDVACRRPGTDSPCVGTKFLREFCQTLNWQQPPANLIIDDNTKIGLRNRLEYGLGNIGEYR